MTLKKIGIAAVAVAIATAIALSGTFAWQSISQVARNEATEPTNPGGRLHDDFSGYEDTDTKDIYVENFGKQTIFARVRLDEYMEIGEGAGLKGAVGAGGAVTPNPDNHATSLVAGANIDDVTTWTTHIPGATSATTGVGTETGFTDPSKTFHTYWTWTMGGQAADNPDGKTVYMPTFNKNKDSLMADINGTLGGFDHDPDTGEHYDDYHGFTNGETADRVLDPDAATYPDGAAYDADGNTVDECGPYGGAGGTGAAGTNYKMESETHTAQETMHASVITMDEYKHKTDAEKADFLGWVYDVDGWAYWSQPIKPGTPTDTDKYITNATGVLLDRIVLEQEPSDTWYYSINAVGQFITADDLGRADDPKTGFYTDGEDPTDDALDLLEGIGVNTAAVKGSITPSASVTVDSEVKHLDYAVQGMSIDLSAKVTVPSVTPTDQTVTWTVSGNTDPDTKIDTTGATPVLKVGASEEGTLKLVAASTAYDRLKGKLTLPVHELAYTVTVTADGGATGVLPGGSQDFTAVLGRNDFQAVPAADQAFTWELDTTGVTYKSGTTLTVNASDSSKATLTVAGNESGTIKLTATPTNTTAYPGLSGTATIPVTAVTYTLSIKDSAGNKVTGTAVEVPISRSATFTVDVTSIPAGAHPSNNWTWVSDDTAKATVSGTGASATVSIPAAATAGQRATITATNTDDSSLTVSFTVKGRTSTMTEATVGDTVAVDGEEYIVLLKDVTVNGKAKGETTPTNHQAALLLAKETQGNREFDASVNNWMNSTMRKYLNGTTGSDWLVGKTNIQNKAITVELKTRQQFDSTAFNTTEDTVFLLSSADVCGQYHNGSNWVSCANEEYTYNNARIPYFGTADAATAETKRVAYSGGRPQTWWLRSPSLNATNVGLVFSTGTTINDNYRISNPVRPAFWYDLGPAT